MALRKYERVSSKDPEINRVQDRLDSAFVTIFKSSIIDGILIENLHLSTSTLEIPHKLGRRFIGFLNANTNANDTIYRDASSTSNPSEFIALKASGSVTAKVWVF